jgi:hypothetical protein
LLVGGLRTATRFGITWRREEVNGQPGALFLDREARLIGVTVLDVAEGQIQGVSAIVNPDKLRHLGPGGRPPRAAPRAQPDGQPAGLSRIAPLPMDVNQSRALSCSGQSCLARASSGRAT